MNILSIDTSTHKTSIALAIDKKVYEHHTNDNIKASQTILASIENIMQENNFKASNLTGILFNKGPASFTGTRVAASVTQAIGYSFNIPVIGISSLALMAFKFYKNNNITNIGCVKKAYGEKLYIGHYDIDLHKYEPQDKIKLCTINEIKLHKNYRYVSDDWSNISIDSDNLLLDEIKIDNISSTDAVTMLDFFKENLEFGESFDLEETFPDYANHTIEF